MARIPLQVGTRSLDTGSIVQYPGSTPVADAIVGAGNQLQGVAARLQQKQEQKDSFDLSIRENELAADLSRIEDEAVQSAPADGSGLHDSVYGELDPVTKKPVKPGSFDQVFNNYLERVPESKRQEFEAKKDVYRLRGSARLAQQQYSSEQAYYKVEIQKTQNDITNAMAMADPNDDQTFEAFKSQGLDIIEKSGLPALEKDVARENWLANADETLFKTKLAKDPAFAADARSALGLAPPPSAGDAVGGVVDKIIGVESGGNADAKNPNSSASGLGQFTNSTWIATIDKHRPDLAGLSRSQKLALKTDKKLGRAMTTAHTQDNAAALSRVGAPVTEGNLYLAHFAGIGGAQNILRADDDRPIIQVLGPAAVEANPFLKGKTVGWVKNWANEKMGQSKGGSPVADPRFANIPLDRRLVLANQADVQVNEQRTAAVAMQKAEYASHKDALELQIVQGQIKDEALISNDRTLNDGDKATLIRSFRTENEKAITVQSDLTALAGESLQLDPYDGKSKTRADNLYSAASKNIDPSQAAAVASAIIQQTGIVPQPVMNDMRRGLTSTNVADVLSAAQTAQRISSYDPAVLARRDGGNEVQKAADDFTYFVNKLNMTPEDAAQRLIDGRNPEKQFTRKALEPAAKEFIKTAAEDDLSAAFDDSWIPGNDPALGVTPAQEAGIRAEYLAIAEDQFYQANGDPELAKNRAMEQMKRLYGVTDIGGSKTVMKHPPEKHWPKLPEAGFLGFEGDPFGYAKKQLQEDIQSFGSEFDADSISLVTTPDTDAMVKRGELPAYSVLYKDKDGVYQTIPGKLWRPDVNPDTLRAKADEARLEQEQAVERARGQQELDREEAEIQALPDGGREQSLDAFIDGPAKIPAITAEPPAGAPTLQDKLDVRRDELFENAPTSGGGGW
jgi:hypothetical protein